MIIFKICGDFNLCCESKLMAKDFLNLINSLNLIQSVSDPTHETGCTLDLMLSCGLGVHIRLTLYEILNVFLLLLLLLSGGLHPV